MQPFLLQCIRWLSRAVHNLDNTENRVTTFTIILTLYSGEELNNNWNLWCFFSDVWLPWSTCSVSSRMSKFFSGVDGTGYGRGGRSSTPPPPPPPLSLSLLLTLSSLQISTAASPLTRHITSQYEERGFHSSLRGKMVTLPIIITSLIHFSLKGVGEWMRKTKGTHGRW